MLRVIDGERNTGGGFATEGTENTEGGRKERGEGWDTEGERRVGGAGGDREGEEGGG